MSEMSMTVTTTMVAIAITAMPSIRPMCPTSSCSGVGCSWGCFEHQGDGAHLRVHAGGGDQSPPGPLRHRGAFEHHVAAVCQRRPLIPRPDILEDCLALSGERSFLDAKRGRLDEARIRPDRVAFGQEQQVAGNQFGARHTQRSPVSHDARGCCGHACKSRHRALRARLLHMAQRGVGDDDQPDHDGVDRPVVPAFDHPGDHGHCDGAKQQVDQRILELRQDPAPAWYRRRSAKFVCSLLGQAVHGLHRRESGLRVGPEKAGDLLDLEAPGSIEPP
jgi:hypothetical protein